MRNQNEANEPQILTLKRKLIGSAYCEFLYCYQIFKKVSVVCRPEGSEHRSRKLLWSEYH